MVKITNEKPACWDRLEKEFNLNWNSGMIVTYGGVIHTKSGYVSPDFLAHELVHVKQQEGWNPDKFLEEFIGNPAFRKEMETAAYRVQALFLDETVKDENERFCLKHKLAKGMVRNYGEIFTYKAAADIIGLCI